jgi:ribosomal protein S18 acetylase RimI-like enzyme
MLKIRNVLKGDLDHLLWDDKLKILNKLEAVNYQRFIEGKLLWLVAEDGEPIGQIKARIESCAVIFALRVLPKEQGKGIGSKLISAMEGLVVSSGFSEVTISVQVDNQKAQKLYERLGYKEERQGMVEEWEYADENGEICRIKLTVNRLRKILGSDYSSTQRKK